MVTLNDTRSTVLKHAITVAGEVLNIKNEHWFDNMLATCTKDDWYLTEMLNKEWIESAQTTEDEARLYSSVEYALDICKCYTHYTRASVNATIRGILDIRKKIPNFAEGWTFVDYFAGVGLSTIYMAQQLTAAGINAKVVYFNSERNTSQVALAKRFYEEFGSPSNMVLHLTDDQPIADCYLFYEVFEHIRQPWDFVQSLINTHTPKCIIHASRFNLPLVSGHFKNYTIDGKIVSGKIATRDFERKFKTANFVRVVVPQEFNGIPRFQVHDSVMPADIATPNRKWDLKTLKKLGQL